MPRARALTVAPSGSILAPERELRRDGRKKDGRWEPGHSGNPSGRTVGTRNKFSENFLVDFADSWEIYGRAALEATAMEHPADYVRVAAGIIPKEMHATVVKLNVGRLSNSEIDALIEREIRGVAREEEAHDDHALLPPLGDREPV